MLFRSLDDLRDSPTFGSNRTESHRPRISSWFGLVETPTRDPRMAPGESRRCRSFGGERRRLDGMLFLESSRAVLNATKRAVPLPVRGWPFRPLDHRTIDNKRRSTRSGGVVLAVATSWSPKNFHSGFRRVVRSIEMPDLSQSLALADSDRTTLNPQALGRIPLAIARTWLNFGSIKLLGCSRISRPGGVRTSR